MSTEPDDDEPGLRGVIISALVIIAILAIVAALIALAGFVRDFFEAPL